MNKKIKIFDLSEQYKSISKEVDKNVLNIELNDVQAN